MQVTNRHRKAVTRALPDTPPPGAGGKAGRPKRYGLEAATALKTLREASDRICIKRLKPSFPIF